MITKLMSVGEIQRMADELKELCKPGDRVELISPMDDPFTPLSPGNQGTVQCVSYGGVIDVSWDHGRVMGHVL